MGHIMAHELEQQAAHGPQQRLIPLCGIRIGALHLFMGVSHQIVLSREIFGQLKLPKIHELWLDIEFEPQLLVTPMFDMSDKA